MIYKSLKGLAPQYMAEMYKFVHDVSGRVHDIQTKLSCIWHLVHTSRFILSFQFSFAEARDRLPAHVRESQSIGVFKAQYFKCYVRS